jgi:hypothetical protein
LAVWAFLADVIRVHLRSSAVPFFFDLIVGFLGDLGVLGG